MNNRLPRAPKFEYAPVNQCIYCGDSTSELTDEHIIPFGLNGNFVLPKSSCKKCAEITSRVEHRVLRGFLDVGRRAMGVSSRHKKHNKSPTAPVKFIHGQIHTDGEMPIDGGFHTIHLPEFTMPLVLGGKDTTNNPASIDVVGIHTLHIGDAIDGVKYNRATGVEITTRIDIWSFVRMLAKIAYSYCVAEKGLFPKEESPVLPIALQKHNNAKEWIGCLEGDPLTKPDSNALHLLGMTEMRGEDGKILSVVGIKLFSVRSGPTYSVVVRIRRGEFV